MLLCGTCFFSCDSKTLQSNEHKGNVYFSSNSESETGPQRILGKDGPRIPSPTPQKKHHLELSRHANSQPSLPPKTASDILGGTQQLSALRVTLVPEEVCGRGAVDNSQGPGRESPFIGEATHRLTSEWAKCQAGVCPGLLLAIDRLGENNGHALYQK